MNAWQIAKEFKSRLESRAWPGVGGETVFGAVRVIAAPFDLMYRNMRTPHIAIRLGGSNTDSSNPDLVNQIIEVQLTVRIEGDEIGENAITGANRTGGQTTSHGRGLLEVEEQLKIVANGMIEDRILMTMNSESDSQGILIDDIPFAAYRIYNFVTRTTINPSYFPVQNLLAVPGVGTVSLSWTLPPSRYDLREIIVRRAAGAIPPATPTAGTPVILAGLLDSAVVDAPGSGTFSYSVFAGYDETGSGANERFSDQVTGTTRASVVVP